MLLTTAFTVGLIAWIVLYSIGMKGFDAFLVTITITLVASLGHILKAYRPGRP